MATNRVNGKQYVGQVVGRLEKRKQKHLCDAITIHKSSYFSRAIRKHGFDSFDWEILHDGITDIDFLNRLEIFYIGYYDTYNNGYNLTLGGGGSVGYKHTKKSLKKMSAIGKINNAGSRNPMYGRKGENSPISGKLNVMFGKHHSDEAKKKMSETLIRRGNSKGKNNPMYGVHRFGEVSPHAHPIMVEGVRYYTKKQAVEETGISFYLINKRIKDDTYDYQMVEKGR